MARYPETTEAIQMFAKGMNSRQVAERLNLDDVAVKNIKYNYRDEIEEARRVNERKAKAEALHAMMAKPKPEPEAEPAVKGEPLPEAPESANEVWESANEAPTAANVSPPELEQVAADTLLPGAEPGGADEHWTDFLEEKPVRARMPDGRYAMEGVAHPQTRRLKVCGYLGEGGRVYAIEGPVIKIAGLASKFTPDELRALSAELKELLEAVDNREGCA